MKRCAMFLLLALACLLPATPSWATWELVSTGTTTGVGNPSCAAATTNLVACAVQSSKSVLMVNRFNGTSWGTWTSLTGTVTSAPNCTSDGSGNVFCVALSAGSMIYTIFDGSTWKKTAKVAGPIYSAPACAEYVAGEVLCVATNASGNLAWSLYSSGKWSKFASVTVPNSAFSAPSCATDDIGGVVCAVYSVGYAMLVNRFSAGAWEGFLSLGGAGAGAPYCTSLGTNGQLVCYAEAYNSGLYANFYNFYAYGWSNLSWAAYEGLGGVINTNASCTSQAAGEQICGVYGIGEYDNVFYVDVYNGSAWSGYEEVGGTGVGIPSCAPLGSGEVVCVIMQPNNELTSAVGP